MSDEKPVRGRPRVYQENYPDDLIAKMAQGLFDYEIYADWDISKDTFYRWLREYPDLKEAYDIGMAKCLKWWTTVGKERCMAMEDKGFKYWISIMNNKFGWGKDDARASVTNNTQININQMQVINSKEEYLRLESEIKEKLLELNVIDVPEIENIKILDHDQLDTKEE